tara:strand:- start:576 stop:926 length:351 start_codon:yes stop_codon:yes gene_type:complete
MKCPRIERIVNRLSKLKKLLPEKQRKEVRLYYGDKSMAGYTYINGTNRIYICMKTNNINALFFVCIHEYAHLLRNNTKHDKKFWDLFYKLVSIAMKNKLLELDFENMELCGDILIH